MSNSTYLNIFSNGDKLIEFATQVLHDDKLNRVSQAANNPLVADVLVYVQGVPTMYLWVIEGYNSIHFNASITMKEFVRIASQLIEDGITND